MIAGDGGALHAKRGVRRWEPVREKRRVSMSVGSEWSERHTVER